MGQKDTIDNWQVRHMSVETRDLISANARLRGLPIAQMITLIVNEWLEINTNEK